MWFTTLWNSIFGGSTSGKSVAEEVADTVKDYKPGAIDEHNMAVENEKVGDESQAAARAYESSPPPSGMFDTFVDALNRLPRPMFAMWAFAELTGILETPASFASMNPIVLNIIWTIIGFYFGIRTISQDLPKAVQAFYDISGLIKSKK